MREDVYTYDPGKESKVLAGYINGDTFYRKINSRKHFIKAMGCYGVQDDVKNFVLSRIDVKWFVFLMKEPKKEFRMLASKLADCKPVSKKICGKHGDQTAIWLSQMREVRNEANTKRSPAAKEEQPKDIQGGPEGSKHSEPTLF